MTLNWITPIKKATGICTVTILPIWEGTAFMPIRHPT